MFENVNESNTKIAISTALQHVIILSPGHLFCAGNTTLTDVLVGAAPDPLQPCMTSLGQPGESHRQSNVVSPNTQQCSAMRCDAMR